ncbi:hypothetical protein Pint_04157 [Pistacia integerrima]|uniref:Uncharacterized protein n=1 Tax=Pistacia integerrima TaxID=434235 RepID=A0ACC0Z725_9ROSI|nr:hypothetical protein Pint_04157 [Pistacia integerrima]
MGTTDLQIGRIQQDSYIDHLVLFAREAETTNLSTYHVNSPLRKHRYPEGVCLLQLLLQWCRKPGFLLTDLCRCYLISRAAEGEFLEAETCLV